MTDLPEKRARRLPGEGDAAPAREDADRSIDLLHEAEDGSPAVLADLAEALALRFWLVLEEEGEDAAERNLTVALGTLSDAVTAASGKNRLRAADLLGALSAPPVGEESTEDALRAAIALFSRAATRHDPDPSEAAVLGVVLADRYERDGLPADRDEAIIWLRRTHDVVIRSGTSSAPGLLRLAELLSDRAEGNRDAADAAAAIGYAQRCLADLADDDPDRVFPLYWLGRTHLVRADVVGGDARDDLEVAAGYLSAALGALPDGHPGRAETTVYLGLAMGMWARLEFGTLPDPRDTVRERADEAVRLITGGMTHLLEADPLRAVARFHLAVLRATRLIALRSGDDEAAVLAALAEVLDAPGCPVFAADACHILSAALPVAHWMPEDIRPGSAAIDLASLGHMVARPHVAPPQDVVDAAIAHLDQVSEEAATDPEHAVVIAWLRAFLTVIPDPGGLSQQSVAQVIAELEESIAGSSDGGSGVHETRGLIGALYGLNADAPDGAENRRRAAESLSAAVAGLPDDHTLREVFLGVLGGAAGVAFEGRPSAQEEVNAAVESLEGTLENLPDDHPDRSAILTRLGAILVQNLRYARSTPHLARMRSLLGEALAGSVDPSNKAINLALLGVTEGFGAMADADPDRHASAVKRLQEAAELVPENKTIQTIVHAALVTLLSQRYMAGGGLEAFDAAMHYARWIVETQDKDDPALAHTVLTMEYFLALQPIARYRSNVTRDQLDAAITALRRLGERLPESHTLHGSVSADLALLQLMRDTDGLDLNKAVRAPELFAAYADAAEAELNATGRDDVFHALGLSITAFAKVNRGLVQRDRRPMDEGIALLAEACERADLHPAQRYQLMAGHGMALRMRYDVTRDRRDLFHAAARLEEARRHAGQEAAGAELVGLLYTLGLIYHERDDRQLGDRRAAAEAGVAAMREVAGDVILQSGETRALDVAAAATGDGVDVARWCLFGGYTESAVEALELGRATVLHAATADAGVPALLREGGHERLAAEWEEGVAGGDIRPWDQDAAGVTPRVTQEGPQPGLVLPSDLRHRVMRAIEGTEVERRLLAPPGVPEIAKALSAARADALVYLLPRHHEGGGVAIVVSDDGEVRDVSLPALAVEDGGLVQAFAGGDGSGAPGSEILPRLCEWAWTAAMEGVLSAVTGGPRRRPRLVLVPVGELGAVPWHAARRRVAGGGWRYACHDAAISYAASARQFVDARRLPARPWNSDPALVRVGESGLFYASQEITEIHRRHYPHGILLGRRRERTPSRLATAGNVGGYLPHADSPGASLLHLGCHAQTAFRPVHSRLLLSGNQILAMTDILAQARNRPKDTAGGLVILAACGSDRTSRYHDEALTLATAFLAAGACGVVGARWEVPDAETAVFMIMFHHYLNSGYDDPATALRAAQLWMLDPDRRIPAGLDSRLAEELACLDLTTIDAWAAFTYQGQ
jgi:hypothetical protein